MVIEMPSAFPIPAKGTINYQFIRVKGNITEDTWVEAAEMRPSNPKVLHHGKVWVLPPGSHWMEGAVLASLTKNKKPPATVRWKATIFLANTIPDWVRKFSISAARRS